MTEASVEALKKKGSDAYTAKNYALAVKAFSEAIDADPKNETLYSNRAAAYHNMEQYDAAIADGKKCVELKPDWSKGYIRQGDALAKKGDYAGAVAIFALGIAKDPTNTILLSSIQDAQKKLASGKSPAEEKKTQTKKAKGGKAKKKQAIKKKKEAKDKEKETTEATDKKKEISSEIFDDDETRERKERKQKEKSDQKETKDEVHEVVVGIDLGTTYSCVGVWEDNTVKIIPNKEGEKTIPSYVSFKKNGERLVGQAAKDRATTHPKQTIFDIKRIIGQRFTDAGVSKDIARFPFTVVKGPDNKPLVEVETETGKKTYACEEISAMVLAELKGVAEAYLGHPVNKAVITVPAYFNDAQRTSTKAAGVIAGLEVMRIINEPTAAALSYGLDVMAKTENATNVLIFDLGGGTFDVSILSIEGGIFSVRATGGDTHLGGEDFDNAVIDYLVNEAEKQGVPDPRENPRSLRRLRNAAEKAKRAVSQSSTTQIVLENLHENKGFKLAFERAKFESLNKSLFGVCLDTVKHVMKDAKMKNEDIHEIVLVGGSTRIPKIQEMLQEYFGGRQLCKALNPDEAVAYGAAVQGAILSGRRNKKTDDLLLMDVTPLSLGIETTGRVMSVIIPRNTPIPCVRTQTYTTEHNYQSSVDIPIYEGERLNSDGNNLLGEFTITGIERAKRGEPQIDVSFGIDTNGILDVSAKDRKTNAQAKIQIKNRGKASDEEIKRMVADAEKFKRSDELRLKRATARNELEQTIIDAMEAAEDLKKKNPKLSDIVKRAAEKEQQWLDELAESTTYAEIVSHRRGLERRIQAQRGGEE